MFHCLTQTFKVNRLLIGHNWWPLVAMCGLGDGAESGGNHYTGPTFSTKACFMVAGNITTNVNKGRQAGQMSGLLIQMSMGLTYLRATISKQYNVFLARSHNHQNSWRQALIRKHHFGIINNVKRWWWRQQVLEGLWCSTKVKVERD